MSRDSSATYLHMHSSRLADLFEEFCHPPSSSSSSAGNFASNNPSNPGSSNANANQGPMNGPTGGGTTGDGGGAAHVPGHFLPFEDILLPPHLMPLNPEDEDDVVPDMHAAFGINRALGQGQGHSGVGGVGGNNAAMLAGGGEMSGAGAQREPAWRDLGLERLLDGGAGATGGGRTGIGGVGGGIVNGVSIPTVTAARREGRRTGVLLLR